MSKPNPNPNAQYANTKLPRGVFIRRRRFKYPHHPFLDSLKPVQTFKSDEYELLVHTVHCFVEPDHVALSLLTAAGSVNVKLPLRLAEQLGAVLCPQPVKT